MDISEAADAPGFRQRVKDFLSRELPTDWVGIGAFSPEDAIAFAEQWRPILHRERLLAPSWPEAYGGGGLSPVEQVVLAEEFARAGVPSGIENDIFSIGMIGNTLLHHGTEEQKAFFLPRILDGTDRWCQGYSEPGAGSDLASLSTRAVLDGDEWVINGQKIWTSSGHLANWIFVLTRTDPEAPKHRGISLLLVPMDQPGVEVRPIINMAEGSDFNEVFFTDARCPAANVVGDVNGGWRVAMTLLGYERGETAAILPVMFRAELDRLIALAKENGAAEDPILRDRIAEAYIRLEIMRYSGSATVARYLEGHPPGPDAAISKLYWSEYHQFVTELSLDILGDEALSAEGRRPSNVTLFMTDDIGAANSSMSWITTAMFARSGTIYAGTSEIQRTIIAEQLLGLPK